LRFIAAFRFAWFAVHFRRPSPVLRTSSPVPTGEESGSAGGKIGRRDANVVTFVANVAVFAAQQTLFVNQPAALAANQTTFVN
jgi:hypothetical protein